MHRLNCGVQKYAWGRKGSESLVAVYKQSQDKHFQIEQTQTYAELWMGTHCNGPCYIIESATDDGGKQQTKLNDYLAANPQALGVISEDIRDGIGEHELPFLFKVLTVNQALSIQAHPNKDLARVLHKNDPKNYPDANHKPEMLVALTNFEALCGFRTASEIHKHFKQVPQLANLCTSECVKQFNDAFESGDNESLKSHLKSCFNELMTKSDSFIREQVEQLLDLVKTDKIVGVDNDLKELFQRLHQQYPFDVGCFSIFLMNYLKMKPGDAIYLQANVPHAYLYGDGVECMACSDNVVRAGLTPKFKDVNTLISMLDYSMKSLEENLVKSERHTQPHQYIYEYAPNVNEFSVQRIDVYESDLNNNNNNYSFELNKCESGSILIIIDTFNNELFATTNTQQNELSLPVNAGNVFFIDANQTITIKFKGDNYKITNANKRVLLAYRAHTNEINKKK